MEVTRRQRQILELAAVGLANKEIGARLGITEQTVKDYTHQIFRAHSDIPSRYAAARWVHRQRIDQWIQRYGDGLPSEALAALKAVCDP